ncbi:MAG: FlgD immunoglobulin-like domain containing protein [Candidatus Eiseniibacteriota bacterium]
MTPARILLLSIVLMTTTSAAVAGPWSSHRVAGGSVPTPQDTIEVTATVPYLGATGTGRGFVLLAPGHAALENPVLVIEGFDLENTMDWDELYTQLNQEGLVESLGTRGFDAVVLDFTDATDYLQRNAFVFTALLRQVEEAIAPEQTVLVVGASMGGLVARYGLTWLESNAIPHRVRTFVSFDAPQRGANIPLGLQHWVEFFASQSADAALFRDILNRPAARQMLVYQFGSTSGSTAAADPLRATFQSELALLGGYPAQPRRVAFANGAGNALGQGYAAGAQLVDYNFSNLLTTIRGDIWALPDGGSGTVFNGRLRIFLVTDQTRVVTVSGTKPYDNAPGGWRASLAQLDATVAPFGDIVALHDAHCFIPTVSALDLDDSDLFLDVSALPDPAGGSPFDAVYWADTNEEHVFISPATASRLLAELAPEVVSADEPSPKLGDSRLALAPPSVSPNPVAGAARIAFTLPQAGRAELRVLAVDGRLVTTLVQGERPAGRHDVAWDGRADRGNQVPPGLYFAQLRWRGQSSVTRIVIAR